MKTLLVALLLLIIVLPAVAQRHAPNRGSLLVAAPKSSGSIPPSGVCRVLWLFTEFPEDTVLPNDGRWPVGQGPSYLQTVIDSTVEQRSGVKNNITTYFRDMSNGRLEVIGTTRYIRAPKPLANYASSTQLDGTPEPENQSRNVNLYVLRDILNQLDKSTDFAQFDSYTGSGQPGADGTIDLVLLCYRHPYNPAIIPELYRGGSVRQINDTISLDQGEHHVFGSHLVFAEGNKFPDRFYVFLNELGRQLLPYPINQHSPGVWSIMRGFQVNSSMMNSIERVQLGWCRMVDVTTDTILALTDYLRTGVAARVIVDRGNGDSGACYLEYHRKNRSPYLNSAARGNDATYDLADNTENVRPGLYILLDQGGFEVVAADGAWNWASSEEVLAPWSKTQMLPVVERVAVNRYNGYTDRMVVPYIDRKSGVQTFHHIYAWRDHTTEELHNGENPLFTGDGNDAWRPDENNIFSLWSNPSTTWRWWDDRFGRNLAIQVVEERGDMLIVRVTFRDPLSLPPSRPQDLHLANDPYNQTVQKLRWERNVEPDVLDSLAPESSPGTFELWRKVETVVGNVIEEWRPIRTMSAGEQSFDDRDYAHAFSCDGADCPVPPTIHYKLRVRDRDGLWSTFSAPVVAHSKRAFLRVARTDARCFVLPNPVVNDAQVFYTVAIAGQVRISIVDLIGKRQEVLVNAHREPGVYITELHMESQETGRFFVFVEMADMKETIPVLYDP
jgi:hypothetical protein